MGRRLLGRKRLLARGYTALSVLLLVSLLGAPGAGATELMSDAHSALAPAPEQSNAPATDPAPTKTAAPTKETGRGGVVVATATTTAAARGTSTPLSTAHDRHGLRDGHAIG